MARHKRTLNLEEVKEPKEEIVEEVKQEEEVEEPKQPRGKPGWAEQSFWDGLTEEQKENI
jgi:hypothetical protein